MPKMSFADYARHRGVSPAAVTRAVQKGRIASEFDPATHRQVIDSESADAAWVANSDSSKLIGAMAAAGTGGLPEPSRELSGEESEPSDHASAAQSYSVSRAHREFYQARLARLNYEQKLGTLVAASEVSKQAFTAARIVREGITNIPDRLAAQLAGETEPRVVHKLLADELARVLSELADGL